MSTNLKVILTAIGVAVLASPVMAQPESTRSPAAISNAHGSVDRAKTLRVPTVQTGNRLDDCIHVQFPQCGGDSTQTQTDRP
jgi:hypothetical protein